MTSVTDVPGFAQDQMFANIFPGFLDGTTSYAPLFQKLAALIAGLSGGNEKVALALHKAAALEELPRDRVPLHWAQTQNNLGVALLALGRTESGAGHLEEALVALREALKEFTRARAPPVRLGERLPGARLLTRPRCAVPHPWRR